MNKNVNVYTLSISILAFAILLFHPILENHSAQKALALFVMVAILWMTEAIPLALTGIMIPVAAILLKLVTTKEAFSQFGNPIIFLFLGGFVLAGALTAHSIDKLLAGKLIKLAKGNFYRSSILMMLCTSLLAFWISNTSSTVMMLPLALGMLTLVKKSGATPEAKFLMLGIAYSANIGGIATMVSSPPNAIGAAMLGITFFEWLKYGIPMFLITFPIMVILLTIYFKPDKKLTVEQVITTDNQVIRPNKTLGGIFLFTIVLWLMEGGLSRWLGIKEGFSSLVAIVAIFLIVITRVLNWEQVIKSVQWNILLLFGGGLTLAMVLEKSGLGVLLAGQISLLANAVPLIAFIWIIVITSILFTEFMSNTASAALLLPIVYSLALQLKVNPMLLVLPATIAASYGFMLPVGTPPNALVFSTGFVPQKDMIRLGAILNILFSIILTSFLYLVFH
ncbi:MAG: DASS family sodium-coupled anion symporter [Taibaiella sp.]|nr:DASS family sodium-coupled anion symporter [Taibaiella sp.]